MSSFQLSSSAPPPMSDWEAHVLSRICAGESLLFPDEARLKIQELFQALDNRKTGKLEALDFQVTSGHDDLDPVLSSSALTRADPICLQDSLPSMHQKKQQLWATLRSVIDFDGNGKLPALPYPTLPCI